ncbi:MAG: hypothetical protein H7228_00600 [Polaromonas sp.]|nr:hypothetical protein [Polaromonas sp.]
MLATPSPHLVIPFARCSGDAWLQTMKNLPHGKQGSLKNLGKLLQGMKLIETDAGEALSLSTPHERVLAKEKGLTDAEPTVDGLIPWAAWEAKANTGKAWAFITPCHWAMGREHATLTDPAALELTETESKTLLAAMQPYFETGGITLHYVQPSRWLAEGEVFRHLPTASLDRVLGRNVDAWLPASKPIKLLQNEMQMLLYTHPLNDERGSRRLRSVNSFWVSGTGALPPTPPSPPTASSPAQHITVPRILAQAAFTDDWTAYAQAWAALDASDIAAHLARQNSGETVRLTLCGESKAQTFETAKPGFFTRISSLLAPQPPLIILEQL